MIHVHSNKLEYNAKWKNKTKKTAMQSQGFVSMLRIVEIIQIIIFLHLSHKNDDDDNSGVG